MITKRDINLYLFYEFGLDIDSNMDERYVTEDWPFQLSSTELSNVYEFTESDEAYYAITTPSLTFYPKAGMAAIDIQVQEQGAKWIGQHEPIDLNTTRIGDKHMPSVAIRRATIETLVSDSLGTYQPIQILEGLFLIKTGQYLVLFKYTQSEEVYILGSNIKVWQVKFPEASPWRRLAIGVGQMLHANELL
jgi:hypothetical protein